MSSIKNILLAPYSMTSMFFEMRGEFGWKIAIFKSLEIFVYHFPSTCMFRRFYMKMNETIYNYLVDDLSEVIKDYCDKEHKVQGKISPIIWQSWWQGEEYLEGITKIATESVKKNLNGLKRILVTKDNYADYVKISPRILKWQEEGRISSTHFSDYLRMALLCQNGGLWVDCTTFMAKPIDLSFINYFFYSTKAEHSDVRYISGDIWASSCMACAPNFPMMELYLKLYETYFTKHRLLIDYYLTDYFMRIAYENISEVKSAVDAVPFNNPMKHSMTAILNTRYNKALLESMFASTTVFKLSRKMELYTQTKKGEITLYGKLLEEYL